MLNSKAVKLGYITTITIKNIQWVTVNSNGFKTLLAYDLSTVFIKRKPILNNGPRSLPKNPHNCTILSN